MMATTTPETAAERGHITRAVEVVLDPSPSQQRWLRSYVGSMRAAYNWALADVRENLDVRRAERDRGGPEDELTPAVSWSGFSIAKRWREVRDEVHPWHRDVSIHAFETGLNNAALALKNYSESRSGKRRGPRVGFPAFKNRHSGQAVTFVELALWQRIYHCTTCGLTLDRDVNAARNIRAEGQRLQREPQQQHVASIRGETRNGEPRSVETELAQQSPSGACAGGRGSFEAATDPASPSRAGNRDLPVPVA